MQDRDVIDALRADLAELTALHAPSGSEQPVIARLRDLFTPLADAVAVDHMGNLTATRQGPQGAPHIVLAHADEIGAMVAHIEPEGLLRLITPASASEAHGFLLPRPAREATIAAAKRAGVPYQLAVINGGGSVTDAAAAHLVAGGIVTLEVKIPRRYSHSPVEMIDLRDLAAVLSLVEELVLHPPPVEELSFLSDPKQREG